MQRCWKAIEDFLVKYQFPPVGEPQSVARNIDGEYAAIEIYIIPHHRETTLHVVSRLVNSESEKS